MALLLFILLWGSLVRGLNAENFELSGTKETRTIMHHKCKGSNLTLNEPKTNVTVLHVFVFLGRETLASTSVPATGLFEDRLTVNNDGKVTLTNLTSDDLGRYRVEVQLAKDKLTYNMRVVIKEPPETSDGKILVMKNVLSDRSSVRLTCGTFTTLGFPPVSAVWKDPAGRTLSSDGFKDQYFYLDLPADTADSGDYCCQLDCRAPDFCCLDDQSPLRSCESVHVQTDKKVDVTTDERVSLANFTQVMAYFIHQQARCEHVSLEKFTQAMAYLVHQQGRCEQLDAYITKVETLEVDMLTDIENIRNTTTDARIHLQRELNQKLWNFQLQMDSNVTKVIETYNVRHQQLMTTVSDELLKLETKLNKNISELHNVNIISDGKLEANVNQSAENLKKLQLQLDTHISRSVESYAELQERLMKTSERLGLNQTAVSNKVKEIETTLNRDGDHELKLNRTLDQVEDLQQRIDNISKAFDEYRSQSDKQVTEREAEGMSRLVSLQLETGRRMSQLENTLRQMKSDLNITMINNDQAMTNLTSKTEVRVSEQETKLSAIRETLNELAANTSQSLAAIRSMFDATSTGQCLQKVGYVWYKGTCLKVMGTRMNYNDAKASCLADDAHLYDIKSPYLDEQRVRFALKQSGLIVREYGYPYFYLGGNDLEVEGEYHWSDGTPLSSSSKLWASRQPLNIFGTEDCVSLYLTPNNFSLNGYSCSLTFYFICQYDS